ncbi:restriction endonuclease subunit S domain-containing protein [Salinibacillus xinjiangensis]|uniref:Restriction endonuclease subunit S n=1 Tax=Salinibacillus xinjiangensis TaxID=1229268 RepID=A0A6G1X720_9BACI|nr:hypothetical protein [Salinibacillus xinjiangensis]MRG86705.1 hypothetical protein [Salinibacillus xinjiangensis]
MLLQNYADVSQGSFLSRIKEAPSDESIKVALYTMKEMNESLGVEYYRSKEKPQDVYVLKERYHELPTTKEGMVLINLQSHQAVAVRKEHTGKLVPSNFAIIEPFDSTVDVTYLEWFINEHPSCRKQLRIATQGTVVAALSIKMLRELNLQLPTVNKQKMIGNMNRVLERKKRLINERLKLEELLIKQLSINYLKEEVK